MNKNENLYFLLLLTHIEGFREIFSCFGIKFSMRFLLNVPMKLVVCCMLLTDTPEVIFSVSIWVKNQIMCYRIYTQAR